MIKISQHVCDAKAWWQSKTIIGTLLMVIPIILKMVLPESEIDLSGAVDEAWAGAEELAAYADSFWAQLQAAFGAVLAIYGRIKAKVGIR